MQVNVLIVIYAIFLSSFRLGKVTGIPSFLDIVLGTILIGSIFALIAIQLIYPCISCFLYFFKNLQLLTK